MKQPPPSAKQIALKALASVLEFGNERQKREARFLAQWIERAPLPPPRRSANSRRRRFPPK